MKKVTQCSIRNCPLWKRAQLITGYCLLASPFVTIGAFFLINDWRGFLFVFGGATLLIGILFAGVYLIISGEE